MTDRKPEINAQTQRRPAAGRTAGAMLAVALASTALTGIWWQGGAHATALAGAQPATASPQVTAPASLADLAARVGPAVVRIGVTTMAPDEAMPGQDQNTLGQHRVRGEGSGFIVDASGVIVTNNHVVGGARQVTVTLADGRDLPARVIGTDARTDLAVLKVEAGAPLPVVGFAADSDGRVGDWVMAMGNPFGLGGTVTAGIISARGRQIGAGPYDDFIQTDASINPGNSGGPLFNLAGEVVGVNTAIFSPSGGNVGIGFAIPASLASHVVAELRENGTVRRGFLGVALQSLTPAMAQALGRPDHKGALVATVEPASPAAQADIREGDLVLRFGAVPVTDSAMLARAAADLRPGATAVVQLWRAGAMRSVTVTLGSPPAARAEAPPALPTTSTSLGLSLAPAPKGMASHGAVIAAVQQDGRAAEAGLRPGDMILQAGGVAVQTPQDVIAALAAARLEQRGALMLQVARGTAHSFIAVNL